MKLSDPHRGFAASPDITRQDRSLVIVALGVVLALGVIVNLIALVHASAPVLS